MKEYRIVCGQFTLENFPTTVDLEYVKKEHDKYTDQGQFRNAKIQERELPEWSDIKC